MAEDFEAGKTGAKMFASDCSGCHKSTRGLAKTMSSRALVDFLRAHYTTGVGPATEIAGYLHCFDARTGEHHWVYDFKDDVWGSPYFVDGKVMLGTSSGDFYLFDHGKTLKEPKKLDMNDPLKTTPTVVDGVLYIATHDKLYAIRLK